MIRNIKPDDQPLCADPTYDAEMWFPEPSSKENPLGVRYAKVAIDTAVEAIKICDRCPLQAACIEYSMESLETIHYGIYGGTLPFERQRAIGAGDISNTITWQGKIRTKAEEAGLIAPYIARRERPELLVSLQERASWRVLSWDSSEQAS